MVPNFSCFSFKNSLYNSIIDRFCERRMPQIKRSNVVRERMGRDYIFSNTRVRE